MTRSLIVSTALGVALAVGAPAVGVVRTSAGWTSAPTPIDETYREIIIPAGTRIPVRLGTSVSSSGSHAEDPVTATVIAPVKVRGVEVIPSGAVVKGQVVLARPSARVKGRARLALRFHSMNVRGDVYPMAAQVSRVAPATKGEDAEKIALPAVGGAVVGAITGGKKGAAIGAAAGAGAGTAVVLSTRGREVSLAKGSAVTLRLQKAVKVRVPVKR